MLSHKILAVKILFTVITLPVSRAGVGLSSDQDLNGLAEKQDKVKVNKCCENSEVIRYEDSRCMAAKEANLTAWIPVFTSEDGVDNVPVDYQFVNGIPACDTTQLWRVYHLPDSEDKLVMLPDGTLRHFINHQQAPLLQAPDKVPIGLYGRINEPVVVPSKNEPIHHDYLQGKYCMDKAWLTQKNQTALCALICIPEVIVDWTDTEFLMRKIVNPLVIAISMVCLLVVAIVYFVLPTLRDLAGNIVTTICVCLIVTQVTAMIRVFSESSNHVSFMVADMLMYISLLAVFFWLNSFGFYIWKTFRFQLESYLKKIRQTASHDLSINTVCDAKDQTSNIQSRNVFLRVTDGRKYCYYSCYAWGMTFLMAVLAVFAHFFLDSGVQTKNQFTTSLINNGDQETIGWLGIAIFFAPIAFTVIIDIFFYATTRKIINRMNTYGRIHHKLKHSFDMFTHLFAVITPTWLLLMLSWLPYDIILYCYILMNLIQGVAILYICVVGQKHVTFLLRKSCCYAEPVPTGEWGDEMTHMNGGNY